MKCTTLLLTFFLSACTLSASSLTTENALKAAPRTHQRKYRNEPQRYQTPQPGRSNRGPKGKIETQRLKRRQDKRSNAFLVDQMEDADKDKTIISRPHKNVPSIEVTNGIFNCDLSDDREKDTTPDDPDDYDYFNSDDATESDNTDQDVLSGSEIASRASSPCFSDDSCDADDQPFKEWIVEADRIGRTQKQAYRKYTYRIAQAHQNADQ